MLIAWAFRDSLLLLPTSLPGAPCPDRTAPRTRRPPSAVGRRQPAEDLTGGPSERELLTASYEGITRRIDALRVAQRLLEHLLSCPRPNPVQDCEFLRAEVAGSVAVALNGSADPASVHPVTGQNCSRVRGTGG